MYGSKLAGCELSAEEERAGSRAAPDDDERAASPRAQGQNVSLRVVLVESWDARSGVPVPPRPDDERRGDGDPGEREDDGPALDASARAVAGVAAARGPRFVLPLVVVETGGVLIDVDLAVEAEIVGIRAEKTARVRVGRQTVEVLLFEGADVLRADLRRELGLGKADPLPLPSGSEAVTDLEHAPQSSGRLSAPRMPC